VPDGVARVHDRATFEALRREGRRGRSGSVTVVFLADPHGQAVRVAYAVGRRVGSAVVRNRVRRRLRAVMRSVWAEGRLLPGSYLVVAAPTAVGADWDELGRSVRRAVADAVRSGKGGP